MVLSSTLTKALKLSLALMVAAPLATGAWAQQTKRNPLLPNPDRIAPWQKALDKLYRPANPQDDLDKAKR